LLFVPPDLFPIRVCSGDKCGSASLIKGFFVCVYVSCVRAGCELAGGSWHRAAPHPVGDWRLHPCVSGLATEAWGDRESTQCKYSCHLWLVYVVFVECI